MLYFAFSTAKDSVKLFNAPLVEAYPHSSSKPLNPTIDPILIIEVFNLFYKEYSKKIFIISKIEKKLISNIFWIFFLEILEIFSLCLMPALFTTAFI